MSQDYNYIFFKNYFYQYLQYIPKKIKLKKNRLIYQNYYVLSTPKKKLFKFYF